MAALAVIAALSLLFWQHGHARDVEFRAQGSGFQIRQDNQWRDFLIKGVNMGVGKPGYFPGEMQITKEEYMDWFTQIGEMNANAIRVYTIQPSAFYEAFYEYNLFTKNPLYLFHGVWLNEDAVVEYQNAYAPQLTGDLEEEITKLVDVLHGNRVIAPSPGHASGTYRWDISPYVAGYILGIELDAVFVINTNDENPQVTNFTGDYLYTAAEASPHECWLAKMGDFTIGYEQNNYGVQKPISWVNWLTTDPLWHDNEPSRVNPSAMQEDAVSVDTEHILAKDSFTAGLFASYHIYPYYPEFMMFQPEYAGYVDETGKQNPYEAYLLELRSHHTIPVLVAEFGLPTSRGCTHENILTGYNQGGMTEEQQGEYVADMFDSMVRTDYAGGLVFTWQDEWFKRSWNTMDFDLPERRPFWSNAQVSEQSFGLLAFEPGAVRTASHADGDLSEWKGRSPVCQEAGLRLYAMSDEKYVYFLIQDDGADLEQKKYVIGVDSLDGQGNKTFTDLGLSFSGEADTAIVIDGKENSALYVDAYYDSYYRQYSLLGLIARDKAREVKNSGIFSPMYLMLSAQLTLPLTGEVIPLRAEETGRLVHGNTNPDSADYNSLADFYIAPGLGIELRIPWQLLNVADPSTKTVIGDLYANDDFNINPVAIDGFSLELHAIDKQTIQSTASGFYTWKEWTMPSYHERLKKSYWILKEYFSKDELN